LASCISEFTAWATATKALATLASVSLPIVVQVSGEALIARATIQQASVAGEVVVLLHKLFVFQWGIKAVLEVVVELEVA